LSTDAEVAESPIVDELLGRIAERTPPDRQEAVAAFAASYLRRIPADVLATLRAEELFGQVVGAFELADGRGDAPFVVRAFNPGLASDGYATVGSVLETSCDDSPFLVDSVTAEIASRGLGIRLVVHPVIGVQRSADGRIESVLHAREAPVRESMMHFEVDQHLTTAELDELADVVRGVLRDVQASVRDFAAMRERLPAMVETARAAGTRYAADEVEEAVTFLEWLSDHNFVFLGYREYAIDDGAVAVVPGSGLGILADEESSHYAAPVPLIAIEPKLRDRIAAGDLLIVAKTNRFSTVHRRARLDYIGVKRVDADGSVVGELRLIGLFTSKAYNEPASRVPILRRKLRQIIAAEDLFEGSHDHKAAVALYDTFPKDELFSADVEQLRHEVVGLLDLQERAQVRLFVRPDLDGRRVSLLVALPRDHFNAAVRTKLQSLFLQRLDGDAIEYHLSLGDEDLARIHFTVHVHGEVPQVSTAELEQQVVAITRTWDDRLRERLVAMHGEEKGTKLADRWAARFPDYYKSATDIYLSVLDIEQFERVEAGEPFVVSLQNERAAGASLTRVGLYKPGGKVNLSDFLPILEDLGLTVVEEVPTRLLGGDGETFLHDFGVLGPDGRLLDVGACGERVAECVSAVWRGEAESDRLNTLVVSAGLTWRQVAILRAYRKYRQRVGAVLPLEYQNEVFARNPAVVAKLVRYFELRFDPAQERRPEAEEALRAEILADLDSITSLDDDRTLRNQLGTVDATVRTNAFQPDRAHVSFKLDSPRVPLMPKPHPVCEIYVYSPRMEGIHLRGGRVARGGIRWSDRPEDYRTEILGLMKAQMVKNAVIVPVGSKGGFVLKHVPADRDALRAEVVAQYTTLMEGMLDITDNLVRGDVVHPPGVRVLDGDDPYLVVAADKGTATLSDTANAISERYGFWLGDAYASGGSAGYDHKALGITARGAFESVKRHFRELGHDVMTEPFTVVGVGDMSGDVFGNGMLLSPQTRLVAAFDHRHAFVDPDPDPATSFAERKRLFELPASSWDDYDRAKLSEGGGVYPLTAKSIAISPQARAALGVEAAALTPTELKAAILRAPVDLFWNGGIGTFIKAAGESNAEVGDRTNDAIRVNGADLRVRVVAEGGNLGATQRGRIEFARAGGRINTDAVDNSAGVDCSDHEVNLKILLGIPIAAGDLTRKQRDDLLAEVEPDVSAHVLYDNYLQNQILSQALERAPQRIEEHEDLMSRLEAEGLLERPIEFLPSTEEMAERRRAGQGLTRPELSVLLAYSKRSLKTALLESSLPDDPYLEREIRAYFPPRVVERFGHLVGRHPLRREMIATIIANDVVNSMGITFVSRFAAETGASAAAVARAYWIARRATDAVQRWAVVEGLDGQLDPVVQNDLMIGVDTLVEDVARWYLVHATSGTMGDVIDQDTAPFSALAEVIDRVGTDDWRAEREAVAASFVERGVDPAVARRHAFQVELAHGPDILAVARAAGRPLEDVANAFFMAGERLRLDWLEARLAALAPRSRWERWASQAVGDDLMAVRRQAAQLMLEGAPDAPVEAAVDAFASARAEAFERLERLVETIGQEDEVALPALTVALRQVRAVVG
jgi:glutamate dehydrogenase